MIGWGSSICAAAASVLVATLTGLLGPQLAQAAPPLTWDVPVSIDPSHSLVGLSCPSTSLCVAADNNGNVLTTTNPIAGASAWSAPVHIDSLDNGLNGLSCVPGLCVVADSSGNVITSTNPTGGIGAWSTPVHVDETLFGFSSMSCASTALCVGTDYSTAGDVVTTIEPTGGAKSWVTTGIDASNRMSSVSCPATSLCVAADGAGDVVASTSPAGGAKSWTAAHVDGGNTLGHISCPSATFCVVGDSHGQVLTSTNPTGGGAAWSAPTQIDSNPGGLGIACSSTSLCAAIDEWGNVVVSTDPTGGSSTWTATNVEGGNSFEKPLSSIACPSSELCLAGDTNGNIIVGQKSVEEPPPKEEVRTPPVNTMLPAISGYPVAGQTLSCSSGAWTGSPAPSFAYEWLRDGVAIASGASYLVQTDDDGHTLVCEVTAFNSAGRQSTRSPGVVVPINLVCCDGGLIISGAQIARLLANSLTPSGVERTIGSLLKHRGLSLSFAAPEAGTLAVGWYQVPKGAHLATKARPTLVASGRLVFARPGRGRIRIKLTVAGKRLLARVHAVKLIAMDVFTPAHGAPIAVTRPVKLKRE